VAGNGRRRKRRCKGGEGKNALARSESPLKCEKGGEHAKGWPRMMEKEREKNSPRNPAPKEAEASVLKGKKLSIPCPLRGKAAIEDCRRAQHHSTETNSERGRRGIITAQGQSHSLGSGGATG